MGLMERARKANRWAGILVEELAEQLHSRSEEYAWNLAAELQETLGEDFHELMPASPAESLAEELAAELREGLLAELQSELPEDVRQILHEDLEKLIFEQLTRHRPAEVIRQLALQREEELAEEWARWVAGEITHHLLERLADDVEHARNGAPPSAPSPQIPRRKARAFRRS
ncbi:MAG: hypothetical protein JXR96_25100 [Deltaproteobacteria bacterium]|nr:hypothetical protein [Deltaproteobacteria bacterium]